MRFRQMPRGFAPLALGVTITLLAPAQAFARAVVRFVHAVPGVGRAQVSVGAGSRSRTVGSIGFGQATGWRSVRSGPVHWRLSGGGRTLATGTTTVGGGAYDLVVMEHGRGVAMHAYRARGGRAGTSLVRVIHAAPELGSPELLVDGTPAVKSLAYTHATPYLPLPAGMHHLSADRPGDATPLVSGVGMTTRAGRSYSAVVVGTRGRQVRVIALVDRGGPRPRSARPVTHGSRAGAHGATVVVRSGDSLWAIARRLVGPRASATAVQRRLVRIWDANAATIGTGDPNLIYPGTVLRV
jgi:hypothetical protein